MNIYFFYRSCSSDEETDQDNGPDDTLPKFTPQRVPGPQLNIKIRKDDLGFTTPLDFF